MIPLLTTKAVAKTSAFIIARIVPTSRNLVYPGLSKLIEGNRSAKAAGCKIPHCAESAFPSQWPFKPWSSSQARKSEWPMPVMLCKRPISQHSFWIFNTSLGRICAPNWAVCHNWTAPLCGYCRAAIVTVKNLQISWITFNFPVDFGSLAARLIGISRPLPQSSPYPWAHALHRHLAASAGRRCTHPIAAPPHLTPRFPCWIIVTPLKPLY